MDNRKCKWIEEDGSTCGDTNLYKNTKYCFKHYIQVIWEKTAFDNKPHPEKVEWITIITITIIVLNLFLSNIFSEKWYFPEMIENFISILKNPELYLKQNEFIIHNLGWLAYYVLIMTSICLLYLEGCFFPLRAKTRIRYIRISFITSLIFVTILLYSVFTIGIEKFRMQWISWIPYIIAYYILYYLIYRMARLNKPKNKTMPLLIILVIVAVLILSTNLIDLIVDKDHNIFEILVKILNTLFFVDLMRFFIFKNRKSIVIESFMDMVTRLSDSLMPLNQDTFVNTENNIETRSKAFEGIMKNILELDPKDREVIFEMIYGKSLSKPIRIILGILSLIVTSFMIAAPAQQLFIYIVCKILNWGEPFCF